MARKNKRTVRGGSNKSKRGSRRKYYEGGSRY